MAHNINFPTRGSLRSDCQGHRPSQSTSESPHVSPTLPTHVTTSPICSPTSPAHPPMSPIDSPISLVYPPTSPVSFPQKPPYATQYLDGMDSQFDNLSISTTAPSDEINSHRDLLAAIGSISKAVSDLKESQIQIDKDLQQHMQQTKDIFKDVDDKLNDFRQEITDSSKQLKHDLLTNNVAISLSNESKSNDLEDRVSQLSVDINERFVDLKSSLMTLSKKLEKNDPEATVGQRDGLSKPTVCLQDTKSVPREIDDLSLVMPGSASLQPGTPSESTVPARTSGKAASVANDPESSLTDFFRSNFDKLLPPPLEVPESYRCQYTSHIVREYDVKIALPLYLTDGNGRLLPVSTIGFFRNSMLSFFDCHLCRSEAFLKILHDFSFAQLQDKLSLSDLDHDVFFRPSTAVMFIRDVAMEPKKVSEIVWLFKELASFLKLHGVRLGWSPMKEE